MRTEIQSSGFVYQDVGDGFCKVVLTPRPSPEPLEFIWWSNIPNRQPYITEGPPRDKSSILYTPGSSGILIFPIMEILDVKNTGYRYHHHLLPWKPDTPTYEQMNTRSWNIKGKNELDLLQLAFQLTDCSKDSNVMNIRERFLKFASIYGPLGENQLAIKPQDRFPTEMAEDLLGWYNATAEMQEFMAGWLQLSLEGYLDNQVARRIHQLASNRLRSVALCPVKAGRKGKSTYKPVAQTLITALWLTVWTEYSEGTEIGKCAVCNSWFSARGHQKSGALPKKTCGNACNQRARYHRDRAAILA